MHIFSDPAIPVVEIYLTLFSYYMETCMTIKAVLVMKKKYLGL